MNSYYSQLKNQVKQHSSVFIAEGAHVIGDVSLAEDVSVWYNAVIRADSDRIEIGPKTNIQDGCVLHVDEGVPLIVGEGNIVGHNAILHGCTLGNYNLIGMGAIVMNRAKIGNYCIIGAGAVVTENMYISDFSLVLGVPGNVVSQIPDDLKERLQWGHTVYVAEAKKYLGEFPSAKSTYGNQQL